VGGLAVFALAIVRSSEWDRKLRCTGRIIGAARDWDVFCQEALPKAFGEIGEHGWDRRLCEAADRRRAPRSPHVLASSMEQRSLRSCLACRLAQRAVAGEC
jgi:CHAD domain-containing protein